MINPHYDPDRVRFVAPGWLAVDENGTAHAVIGWTETTNGSGWLPLVWTEHPKKLAAIRPTEIRPWPNI